MMNESRRPSGSIKHDQVMIITLLICLLLLFHTNGALAEVIDYARANNWAALPDIPNNSMLVPASVLHNRQATARADVFYIYPTVYASFFSNNASVANEDYRKDVANILLTTQASCLNNVGRIYAPYYRQASLWAYLDTATARKKAFNIAYSDVETAFRYYLKHYNRARPLFILSHSQGSQIAVRLLRENYTRLHLGRILVAAYIIGERIGTRTFPDLLPCVTATQTNCFVTWGTVAWGGTSNLMTGKVQGKPICVNPLNWRMDQQMVPREHHLGGVPDSFDNILPHLVGTQCRKGMLNIAPTPQGFAHEGKDYHESDINLFYMDIRHNAQIRLRKFHQQHLNE